MKTNIFIFSVLFLSFSFVMLDADVEIGEEIRIRNYVLNDRDFSSGTPDRISYWEQRTLLYLGFRLNKELSARLETAAKGRFGENPAGDLWFSESWLRFEKKILFPAELKIGRQYYQLGDGVLLSHNDDCRRGLDGIKAEWKLPYRFELTLAGFFLAQDTRTYINENLSASLFLIKKKMEEREIFFMILTEKDFRTENIENKIFYDLRYESTSKTNLFWCAELIKSAGDRQEPGRTVKYDGLSYYLRADAGGKIPGVGRARGRFLYGHFSGTPPAELPDPDPGTNPSLSYTSEKIFGEYFMQNRQNIANYTVSNLNILGYGLSIMPLRPKNVEFFFDAFDTLNLANPGKGKEDLGVELDYGIRYHYSYNFNIRFVIAEFTPGQALAVAPDNKTARKMLTEVELKF